MYVKSDLFLDHDENAVIKIVYANDTLGYELHISHFQVGSVIVYGTAKEMQSLDFWSFEYHDCLKIGTMSIFDKRVNGEDSRLVELWKQIGELA